MSIYNSCNWPEVDSHGGVCMGGARERLFDVFCLETRRVCSLRLYIDFLFSGRWGVFLFGGGSHAI